MNILPIQSQQTEVFHLWACLILSQSNSTVQRTQARVGRTRLSGFRQWCLSSFRQQALSSHGTQDKSFELKKKIIWSNSVLKFCRKNTILRRHTPKMSTWEKTQQLLLSLFYKLNISDFWFLGRNTQHIVHL